MLMTRLTALLLSLVLGLTGLGPAFAAGSPAAAHALGCDMAAQMSGSGHAHTDIHRDHHRAPPGGEGEEARIVCPHGIAACTVADPVAGAAGVPVRMTAAGLAPDSRAAGVPAGLDPPPPRRA